MYQITSGSGRPIGVAHETRQTAVAELRAMARPGRDVYTSSPAEVIVYGPDRRYPLAYYSIEKL